MCRHSFFDLNMVNMNNENISSISFMFQMMQTKNVNQTSYGNDVSIIIKYYN